MFNFLKKENILDFSCQSCGNCCRYFSINITHIDIKRILENRPDLKAIDFIDFKISMDKKDDEAFISTSGKKELVLKKKKNGECIFLENNRCSIHSFKPLVCRVWPFSLEKSQIMWIKEHLSFIRNDCKHIMKSGSNNKDEVKTLIKQHYKERKIFSKLVENWNKDKKINEGHFFYNILDADFIDFILKEIEIEKAISISDKEDTFLENILAFFIANRRIEVILESKFSRLFDDYKKFDFSFIFFVKEENINYFFEEENINNLKNTFNIEEMFFNNREIYFKSKDTKNIVFKFKAIHNIKDENFPYDTFTLYNPYSIDIAILEKEDFKKTTINRIYNDILLNLDLFLNSYNKKEYIESYFILNRILNNSLYPLISINNFQYFDIENIKFLKNKSENLEDFLNNFSLNIEKDNLIKSLIEIVKIIKSNSFYLKDFSEIDNKLEKYYNLN